MPAVSAELEALKAKAAMLESRIAELKAAGNAAAAANKEKHLADVKAEIKKITKE